MAAFCWAESIVNDHSLEASVLVLVSPFPYSSCELCSVSGIFFLLFVLMKPQVIQARKSCRPLQHLTLSMRIGEFTFLPSPLSKMLWRQKCAIQTVSHVYLSLNFKPQVCVDASALLRGTTRYSAVSSIVPFSSNKSLIKGVVLALLTGRNMEREVWKEIEGIGPVNVDFCSRGADVHTRRCHLNPRYIYSRYPVAQMTSY